MQSDARIPVIVTAQRSSPQPGDVFLCEPAPDPAHTPGCACCAPRGAAGRALTALLQDRARGRIPFFTRVVAVAPTAAGRHAIEAALQSDPVASSCFKLGS